MASHITAGSSVTVGNLSDTVWLGKVICHIWFIAHTVFSVVVDHDTPFIPVKELEHGGSFIGTGVLLHTCLVNFLEMVACRLISEPIPHYVRPLIVVISCPIQFFQCSKQGAVLFIRSNSSGITAVIIHIGIQNRVRAHQFYVVVRLILDHPIDRTVRISGLCVCHPELGSINVAISVIGIHQLAPVLIKSLLLIHFCRTKCYKIVCFIAVNTVSGISICSDTAGPVYQVIVFLRIVYGFRSPCSSCFYFRSNVYPAPCPVYKILCLIDEKAGTAIV